MHIVCPHCTTSFAIKLATLGAAGRNVRCSRCKEIWLTETGGIYKFGSFRASQKRQLRATRYMQETQG